MARGRPKVSVKTSVIDKDMGFAALKQSAKELNGKVVSVGILPQDAMLLYKGGETLVTVAHKNEFGIGKSNPERSFMRKTFDDFSSKWFKDITGFMRQQRGGNILSKRVLVFTGAMARDNMKRTVMIMKTPSNAPRTVREKGVNDPLIHIKKLYNNIKYDVTKGIRK